MKRETYEETYTKGRHFSFGRNWKSFLAVITEERIDEAKKSLVKFLGGQEAIRGKTFVDVGCGSGLFSLAAFRLGASRIVSIDVDDFSVSCAKHLREKEGSPPVWSICKGSALDKDFLRERGSFDVVYSWGVLHHTGDMYRALENVSDLACEKGTLYIALYNDNTSNWREGTSKFWLRVKRRYNNASDFMKRMYLSLFIAYYFVGSLMLLRNPFTYIRNYVSSRGMDWYHDRIDWIGGYPYEYARPDEIVNFFGERGFLCRKIAYARGIGCSEYLFVKGL